MRSCTNVDVFSNVWHTSPGFPKRCDQILISYKDILKTHLREVYIMMILYDYPMKLLNISLVSLTFPPVQEYMHKKML